MSGDSRCGWIKGMNAIDVGATGNSGVAQQQISRPQLNIYLDNPGKHHASLPRPASPVAVPVIMGAGR